MMKPNNNIQTITFDVALPSVPGFRVDIIETPEEFEAWLYHINIGIKEFMFGSGKEQHKNRTDFCEMVEVNLHSQGYIGDYINEYMIEDT